MGGVWGCGGWGCGCVCVSGGWGVQVCEWCVGVCGKRMKC